MRLGVTLTGVHARSIVKQATLAESLGYHSLWRGEAYGGDAVTPLVWAAAHTTTVRLGTAVMQMPARSPAMTAMTAISLDQLSEGRAILGLGLSGPQVAEGWHGVPFRSPLTTTEEYVEIVRRVIAGEKKVEFEGECYQLPYRGQDSTGLGKAMRPGLHTRADIPIYLAALGPKNIALASQIADGLLPMLWNPHRWRDAFDGLADGIALARVDVAPTVPIAIGADVQECRDRVRPLIAMYVGGMGAKGKNFYNALVCRYGFEAEATRIQELYLGGDRRGAVAAVPDRLVDELALVGGRDRVADQLAPWRESGVTTLILAAADAEAMRAMAQLVL